jgi:hypothetical protein
MIHDMELWASSWTPTKMDLGHIKVSLYAWGDSVEAYDKIPDCVGIGINPKFVPMDFFN